MNGKEPERERYKVGDRLCLHSRNQEIAVVQQVWSDSKGVVQVVLRNPTTGNDICRSTQVELDRYATRLE